MASELDAGLRPALPALVEPDERGDPMSPLRWTTKSTRNLAAELTRQGHRVSADTVVGLLREEGFSLQANVKTVEGSQHPDRNAQSRPTRRIMPRTRGPVRETALPAFPLPCGPPPVERPFTRRKPSRVPMGGLCARTRVRGPRLCRSPRGPAPGVPQEPGRGAERASRRIEYGGSATR